MLTALWDCPASKIQWSVVIFSTLVAAAWDGRTGRIPNWLTGGLFICGLAWVSATAGLHGLLDGMTGCLLTALPFLLLFVFAGGGAADAKLMGALGLWLGARNGVALLLAVTISGAVLGICYSLIRGSLRSVVLNLLSMSGALFAIQSGHVNARQASEVMPGSQRMQPMPYGLSIFTGACVAARAVWLWKTGRIL
jgi:Flp pilus assembly protein protease CpaA